MAVFARILKAPYGSNLGSKVSQMHPGNQRVTDMPAHLFTVSDKFRLDQGGSMFSPTYRKESK